MRSQKIRFFSILVSYCDSNKWRNCSSKELKVRERDKKISKNCIKTGDNYCIRKVRYNNADRMEKFYKINLKKIFVLVNFIIIK